KLRSPSMKTEIRAEAGRIDSSLRRAAASPREFNLLLGEALRLNGARLLLKKVRAAARRQEKSWPAPGSAALSLNETISWALPDASLCELGVLGESTS